MREIILTCNDRYADLGCKTVDANLEWLANESGYAIVRLYTDIGICCMLHLSPSVHGSIFEFCRGGRSFILSVDNVGVEHGEIVQLTFLAEGWW